jgi:hypothetical protein
LFVKAGWNAQSFVEIRRIAAGSNACGLSFLTKERKEKMKINDFSPMLFPEIRQLIKNSQSLSLKNAIIDAIIDYPNIPDEVLVHVHNNEVWAAIKASLDRQYAKYKTLRRGA